ncbi:MAG: DHH family protein [Methanomassiliicoccales archaeon PtaU1.Bin124]|nr:MAG: DHH family protein [Methanomassiliicoccales archaeon PtaU1.Bin124]
MFESVLSRLPEGRKLVLIHGNADPDAFGSAYALKVSFPDVDICAPEGLDRIAKVVARKFGYEPLSRADLGAYDAVLVVDTSSPEQLGQMNLPDEDWIIIDHHARNERWSNCQYFCDDTRRSCAELVFQLLKEAGVVVSRDAGLALLSGMVTDSGHFRYATAQLLGDFSQLMSLAKIDVDEVFDLTDMEPDVSERIAVLKGGQRMRFERVGQYIVAVSLGSSFESSVCKGMLSLGADIAFVVSQRDESFRLSARTRQDMVRAGLHLGKLLEDIGRDTSCEGGGHPGAAGMTGVGDAEAIANMCMSKAMDFLRGLNADKK